MAARQAMTLTLRASGRVAGLIEGLGDGAARLTYDADWVNTDGAYPLSLSLPLRGEPYEDERVARWLNGLLPYGALRRDLEARFEERFEDASGPFALLARLGGDAPGAFRFTEPGAAPPGLRPVADLGALAEGCDASPLMLETDGVSHTLAEQDGERIPVCLIDEGAGATVAIALFGAPSTHILWLEPKRAMGALENKAFHLALGGAVGLPVSGFRAMSGGGRRMLAVLRDDRERREKGWVRLHRETVAQAMGAEPDQRYGREPGPFSDLESIFLWADGAMEARERLKLLDAFLFNALIGAPDAHLLRYAIRLHPKPALAPLTELAGPGLTPPKERRFAQRIGGAARWPERITAEQWRGFAAAAKFNGTFMLDRLVELATAIEERAAPVADKLQEASEFQSAILGRLAREAKERALDAVNRLRR